MTCVTWLCLPDPNADEQSLSILPLLKHGELLFDRLNALALTSSPSLLYQCQARFKALQASQNGLVELMASRLSRSALIFQAEAW